jgi:hypothetical protein
VPHQTSEEDRPERFLVPDVNAAWLGAVTEGPARAGAHPAIAIVPTPVSPKTAQQNSAKTIRKRLRVSDSITFLLFK